MRRLKFIIALLSATTLSACYQLPVSGPAGDSIVGGATTVALNATARSGVDYAFLDINPLVVENAIDIDPGSFYRSFGKVKGPAPEIFVGAGDVLQLTVFESKSGGLFIPADSGTRPGNFVQLPPQIVNYNGTIAVPYAGAVRAAGKSLLSIQRDIENRLQNRAIEPKVIATLVEQNATTVAVVGEVNAPKKARITQAGERILDMIALAGGIRFPGYETFVSLQRGSKKDTVYFNSLVKNPAENIFARPNDTIYVYREPRRFLAFGAVGTGVSGATTSQQFNFDQERVSLAEAVAKAGGLLDERANPGTIFLYRMEPRDILQAMHVDLSHFPPEQDVIPTVYRANFRDPASYFSAQRFPVRNRDILYVSNAEAVEVVKFLNYARSVTSTVSGVASDVAITKKAGSYIGGSVGSPF